MNPPRTLIMAAALLFAAPAVRAADNPLATLRPGHPRLLVTAQTWRDLAAQRHDNPTLDAFLTRMELNGRALFTTPPVVYLKTGKRLLAVSREAEKRILLLSFDYRVTGDAKFRDRAEKELLAISAFADWDPSHFLDVAEMTAGAALGYDWLYDDLAPATRDIVRQAIVDKGLKVGDDPKRRDTFWYQAKMNWNQVCFGGLTLGALAVADEAPDVAARMLRQAKNNAAAGFAPYAPNGVFPEGPGYWGYGTTYSVLFIAGLESALGTDWGFAQSPGFLASADYMLEMNGASGLVFNYSDGGAVGEYQPALYWFAGKLHRPDLTFFEAARYEDTLAKSSGTGERDRFLPLAAIWGAASLNARTPPAAPLNWHVDAVQPVAVFRSAWDDPAGLYLGVKGGSASLSHAHMDAGSFVLDADGVRWAEDLGNQDYNSLESKGLALFDMKQDSDRWRIFRLNNSSHNTLTIDGALQVMKGFAPMIRFSADAPAPHAVIDLTDIYEGQADQTMRGFKVLPNREVLVQDELTGLKPGAAVRWAMVTRARAQIEGARATLHQGEKEMHAKLDAPKGASFSVIPAAPPPNNYDAPNPGMSILTVNCVAPASGEVTIRVLLQPGKDEPADPGPIVPVEKWSAAK